MKPGNCELLVVPPAHFDVVDSYNTRMRPDHPFGRPDKKKAMEQWSRMISALYHDLGAVLHFVDPVKGLADMAFACDPGLWINDCFVAANFQVGPRRTEPAYFADWFHDHGYEVAHLPHGAYFEGGDCVMIGNVAVIGYGTSRTNWEGIKALKKILEPRGVRVLPIRRMTEEFYHLNSVFTWYPTARLIAYYAEAFEPEARSKVQAALPDVTFISTLSSEAVMRNHPEFGGERLYSYCLNALENCGKVIQPYCSGEHQALLENHGLTVIVPEGGSSEFERSGGSYRCLTMIHNFV